MRVSAALPAGVAALFFEAAAERRRLEGRLAAVLEAAGYGEVLLPILDYYEPYEPLLGAAARGRLYRFVDRGGEVLALRADFTPMLARLLAPRLAHLPLPLRLFYRGDVVRQQEDRSGGRTRELYQLGAELLGAAGQAADEEVLRLFLSVLARSGAPRPQVVLGFAGALDELLLAAGGEGAGELARAVARRERGPARRAARALAQVVEDGLPADPDDLGPRAAERLRALQQLTAALGREPGQVELTIDLAEFARFTLDPRLASGGGAAPDAEGYYDGLVFRAYVAGDAQPVGAGGRYDALFSRLGAALPAVGFSLSLDRLAASDGREAA